MKADQPPLHIMSAYRRVLPRYLRTVMIAIAAVIVTPALYPHLRLALTVLTDSTSVSLLRATMPARS